MQEAATVADERLRDLTETAEMLGVSRSFLSKVVNTNSDFPIVGIKSPTTGRLVRRFRLSDVLEWFENAEREMTR